MRARTRSLLSACLLAAGTTVLPGRAGAQPVPKATFLGGGSFSLPSSGPGALEHPETMAWAPGGWIHIAGEQGTVSVFDSTGGFVRSYGAGSLKKIAALAVDDRGRAYVLDPDAKTVVVFDSTGKVVHRIGSPGNKAGQLDRPVDLALGPAGLVYVLDKGRKGVQVFSLDGTFVHDIPLPLMASDPRALGVAPSGTIYVADKGIPDAVFRLPSLRDALQLAGAALPDTGRVVFRGANIRDPVAVVVTPTGTVVDGDGDSDVLWSADATGRQHVGTDDRLYGGKGSGRGSFLKLSDVALAGTDELLMLDRDGRKVERIRLVLEAGRPAETPQDYPVELQTVTPGIPSGVLASAPTGRGTVWYAIADAEGRNLRVVEASLQDTEGVFGHRIRLPEPAPGRPVHAFGTTVEQAGGAALNDTLLVVTEPRKDRFDVFDLRTDKAIGSFGDNYSDDRRLHSPRGIALFPDGRIAVADHDNGRIVIFSADVATLLGTYPLPKAEGVVVSPDGRLFAWDEDGVTAGEFPLSGGPLQPLPPSLTAGGVGALAVDRENNLYALRRESGRIAIADAGLHRILARVGGDAVLRTGSQLAVDPDGNIYDTDLDHGQSVVRHWGVVVSTPTAVTVAWHAGTADLSWRAVTGSFITGYRVEGAPARDGPWTVVGTPTNPTLRVEGKAHQWFRVSTRALTGSVSDPSPVVPVLHVAAAAAFESGSWANATRLAREALDLVEAGTVTADSVVVSTLRWDGFVAADEAGSYQDALTWQKRLEGHVAAKDSFEYTFRLADTYQHLGNSEAAMDEALKALALAGPTVAGPSTERVTTLRRMVFDDGWSLKRWSDVTAAGEDLLSASGGTPEPALVTRLAQAYLKAGAPDRALELARSAEDAAVSESERHTLTVLSFIAAVSSGDTAAAKEYKAAVGDSVPAPLYPDFQCALTQLKVAGGDLAGAHAQLLLFLLGEKDDIRALADSGVVATTTLVYGDLIAAGKAESAHKMLDTLVAAMPPDLAGAREHLVHQADSVGAVADTRAKLGKGFGYFRNALFRDALRFFQAADKRTDLDVDQRLIVKEMLAAVYHSLGRIQDADSAFRGVYKVDPGFVLDDHLAHVKKTYGLTIFTPDMLKHFRTVGPIM